jgi:hypothetical protein
MDMDSLEHHIRSLTNQHTTIERQLDAMYKQKSWDEYQAEDLKKQKLRLKDQLSEMYRKRHELMNRIDWD